MAIGIHPGAKNSVVQEVWDAPQRLTMVDKKTAWCTAVHSGTYGTHSGAKSSMVHTLVYKSYGTLHGGCILVLWYLLKSLGGVSWCTIDGSSMQLALFQWKSRTLL